MVVVTDLWREIVWGEKKRVAIFVLRYDIKVSFFKKLLYDLGAEPFQTFNWNYSLQLCKENKENLGKMGLVGSTH